MKKKLILVAAPPASGKNYVSELICRSIKNIVYLDKDDLADLLRCSFAVGGKELDMDGAFYVENLRSAEYATLFNLAFSTIRFADIVLINAPLSKEVRDIEYMRALKDRAESIGAELVVVWVSVPKEVCYQRMQERNSDRDRLKLLNWEEYARKINYSAPIALEEAGVVDKFIVFHNENERAAEESLQRVLQELNIRV